MAATLALVLAAGDRSASRAERGPTFAGGIMPDGVKAPAFALRDQDGNVVKSEALRGQVVAVTFVYATCTESCGPQLQLIRGALDDLGRDVPVLAVSADPRTDTPARARRFLLEQRMTGRARFLLGSARELAPVYRGFFVQRQTEDTEHHARIVLLDRRGFQRVGHSLVGTSSEDISHDIRLLEGEAP